MTTSRSEGDSMTRSENVEHVEVLRELEQDGDAGLTEREREAIRQVIASLSAQQSRDAESKLAEAGVFAGHHGLRGLADADEFWEKQPYGTRLYYGDGGMDYLHRGVLQTAVEILDAAPQPPAEAQPVGEAGTMSGTNGGFTMAVFKAADVPVGTKLYTAPPSAPVGVEE